MRNFFILILCFIFLTVNARKGVKINDLVTTATEGRKLIEQGQNYFEKGEFTQAAQKYRFLSNLSSLLFLYEYENLQTCRTY